MLAHAQEAVTADKKPIFRMSAAKGSCKSAISSANSTVDVPINFAVTPVAGDAARCTLRVVLRCTATPVADSQITDGPFKTFADKMLSPLISVQASRAR